MAADSNQPADSGNKELQYGQKDKLRFRRDGFPRYVAVIFCGGRAQRFGDVKTLGSVRGRPLLDTIVNEVNSPVISPTFISLGSYYGELNADYLFAIYDKVVKNIALTDDEKELAASVVNTEEIIDFTYALHLNGAFPRYAYRTSDDSKASCIKNLADCIKGKFEIENLHTARPSFKTNDPTFRAYLNYTLDKSVRNNLPQELKEHKKVDLQDYLKDRLLVTVNGDTTAVDLRKIYRPAIKDALLKLQTEDKAAFIGIFKTAVPKKEGREYLIGPDDVVTYISDKDKPDVTEEAGIFIFNPDVLDEIVVPRAKRVAFSQREFEKEFVPGPNWLCQQLIAKGKTVYAKKYPETIFDLNKPEDYFILRTLLRGVTGQSSTIEDFVEAYC